MHMIINYNYLFIIIYFFYLQWLQFTIFVVCMFIRNYYKKKKNKIIVKRMRDIHNARYVTKQNSRTLQIDLNINCQSSMKEINH